MQKDRCLKTGGGGRGSQEKSLRSGGHGLATNWFLSTDLEYTRRILDAHAQVCVCFGRVAAVPAQLQTAGYYPSSSFIFTRVVSRRARAV